MRKGEVVKKDLILCRVFDTLLMHLSVYRKIQNSKSAQPHVPYQTCKLTPYTIVNIAKTKQKCHPSTIRPLQPLMQKIRKILYPLSSTDSILIHDGHS
jgi:hypothetical protein